jgi:hypothetical protein
MYCSMQGSIGIHQYKHHVTTAKGELAQLVERVLSMHEVAGSIPAFSIPYTTVLLENYRYHAPLSFPLLIYSYYSQFSRLLRVETF